MKIRLTHTGINKKNKSGYSFKFWSVVQKGKNVIVHWGRIGSKGQKKVYDFPTQLHAEFFARDKAESKLAKGYM